MPDTSPVAPGATKIVALPAFRLPVRSAKSIHTPWPLAVRTGPLPTGTAASFGTGALPAPRSHVLGRTGCQTEVPGGRVTRSNSSGEPGSLPPVDVPSSQPFVGELAERARTVRAPLFQVPQFFPVLLGSQIRSRAHCPPW